ncbi:MAG: class I SAM-dependent methyltransferase [Thermodesulfobacteriota bacterium]
MRNEDQHFWHIRSDRYDKLFWVKDKGYLETIVECADLKRHQLVLDVGTGTGVVANVVKKHVGHVVAIDISDPMLTKGNWSGISVVKWDIGDYLFAQGLFDRVIARMVFHHILDNLDRAILRCFDVLKEKGKIIVAEGIPPSDDEEVIDWYSQMFKFKEKRRTFTPALLKFYLEKNGFKNIKTKIHIMDNFSVKNWLENSGLSEKKRAKIYEMHVNADQKIKDAYQMHIVDGDCLIRTVNAVITGQK